MIHTSSSTHWPIVSSLLFEYTYSYYSWLFDYIALFLDFFVFEGFFNQVTTLPLCASYVDPFQDIIPAVLLTSGKSAADTSGDAVRQGDKQVELSRGFKGSWRHFQVPNMVVLMYGIVPMCALFISLLLR